MFWLDLFFYRVDGASVDGSDLHGHMAYLPTPFLHLAKKGSFFVRLVAQGKQTPSTVRI